MTELALFGTDLFGEAIKPKASGPVAERFTLPPFTILDARCSAVLAGWWTSAPQGGHRPQLAVVLHLAGQLWRHVEHQAHQLFILGFARPTACLGLFHAAHCSAAKIVLASCFRVQ